MFGRSQVIPQLLVELWPVSYSIFSFLKLRVVRSKLKPFWHFLSPSHGMPNGQQSWETVESQRRDGQTPLAGTLLIAAFSLQGKEMSLETCSGRKPPWPSPALTWGPWPTVTCMWSSGTPCRKCWNSTRPSPTPSPGTSFSPTTWGSGWVCCSRLFSTKRPLYS